MCVLMPKVNSSSANGGGGSGGEGGTDFSWIGDVSGGGPSNHLTTICGGNYGGGSGAQGGNGTSQYGGNGAVRIMWPGDERAYPSTRTADE